MPSHDQNPALTALLLAIQDELSFGQVLILRHQTKFNLRHVDDRHKILSELRLVPVGELRKLAQFDSSGNFRPLHSAPNLVAGWTFSTASATDLYQALNLLYPGAVADWFAAQSPHPPITSYREFTERQTGMYRIAAMLDDTVAGQAIQTCCDKSLCLKRRLWSVPGLPPDDIREKCIIPCLEPCAIMLEFARKTARIVLDKQAAAVKA